MSTNDPTIPKKRKQAEKPVFVTCQQCAGIFSAAPSRLLIGESRFCFERCRYSYVAPVSNPEEKFWEKVNKTDSCWLWTASKRTTDRTGGYGKFATGRRNKQTTYMAHRFSWVLENGPIPDGLDVLHHCDNRLCVNPDHLFLGTQQDNMDDMIAKGRSAKGEKNPHAILTEDIVMQIREAIRVRQGTLADVARLFGITYVSLQAIYHRRNWKHI
jgi:hypothetical protein